MSTPFQFKNLTFEDTNGTVTNVTQPVGSVVLTPMEYNTTGLASLTFFGTVDVNTPSAGTFTASDTTDLMTQASHGYYTGLVVQVSNAGGSLPTGLSGSTNYYVIRASANTYYLATSAANALAGTYINITGAGSGTQTATPTALASASIYLQGSVDYGISSTATWVTIPNSTYTITADGSFVFELDNMRFNNFRAYATLASGMMTFTTLQIAYKGGGA